MKATCFFLAFLSLAPSSWGVPLKILIDPGHGGADSGAVYGPARESEITLKVAQHLENFLKESPGFQVQLTRRDNRSLSLSERVRIAENGKMDLFLSIHANASTDQRARGVEFYFQNHLPPDEESLFLANLENQMMKETRQNSSDISKKSDVMAILEDLKRNTKMRQSYTLSDHLLKAWNRKEKNNSNVIRQAPFYVISKTSVPSVLIELGFISNPRESQKLIQPEYQRKIAQKIFQGLQEYKEMVDKAEPSRLH